jgi:hypothetical protein
MKHPICKHEMQYREISGEGFYSCPEYDCPQWGAYMPDTYEGAVERLNKAKLKLWALLADTLGLSKLLDWMTKPR